MNRRLSTTPPLLQQPLTKRDKKRQAIEQRLKDIAFSFLASREFHLRNQLGPISRDMHFINRCNPYHNRLLDDNADEVFSDILSQTGSVDGEARAPPLGKYALDFVERVNDTMEQRDTHLTEIHVRQETALHLECQTMLTLFRLGSFLQKGRCAHPRL